MKVKRHSAALAITVVSAALVAASGANDAIAKTAAQASAMTTFRPATAPPVFAHGSSPVGHGTGNPTSISCASARFCMAVDGNGLNGPGSVIHFNGRTWSAPRLIDPGMSLTGVSCPSASFCAAVDLAGAALFYNGARWSKPVIIDNASIRAGYAVSLPLTGVSCTSKQFCVAIDAGSPITTNGDFVMFSGSDPAAARTLPTGMQGLSSVSCAPRKFCIAVSPGYGGYQVYRGSYWTAPKFTAHANFQSVSCGTASFCAGIDADGNASLFNGKYWTRPRSVVPDVSNSGGVVACARRTCFAANGSDIARWNGTRWSRPASIFSQLSGGTTGISCATAQFCAAVDTMSDLSGFTVGSVATFAGKRWSRPRIIDRSNYITAISCATRKFCVLVSAGGLTAVFTGAAWRPGRTVGVAPGREIRWLSCPVTNFCMATDDNGNAYEMRQGHWQRRVHLASGFAGFDVFAVSCASARRCVIVTDDGRAILLTGSRWSRPRPVPGVKLGFEAISCPSARMCMAVTVDGSALILHGSVWSKPKTLEKYVILVAVSCVSASFCLTSDGQIAAWRFNGSNWRNLGQQGASQGLSCGAVDLCGAIVPSPEQGIFFYTGNNSWPLAAGVYTGNIFGIACAGPAFCAATNDNGQVFWS